MRDEDSRDPWMDRGSPSAWEQSLRPARSSGAIWLLIGVVVAAGLLYAIVSLWPTASRMREASRAPQAGSAPSSSASRPPAPPGHLRGPSPPQAAVRTQRFAKCTSAKGSVTYSDGACPAGTTAAEVTVSPDLNLADGMSPEARQASLRDNRAAALAVIEHERQVAMNVDVPHAECAHLKAVIESIDAMARQPLPAAEQDRLKNERRRAHDRRFALRCG